MRKGEETRERIVSRAMALASRDGFEGLTIGSLASDMRLSKSGLFAHFGSKEDLQLRVLETAVERFTAKVIVPALHQPRGESRVRALFENWFAWATDPAMPGGCVLLTACYEFDDKPGPQRDFIEKSMRDMLHTLARCASTAVDAGQFRKDLDVQQFAHDVYAVFIGYNLLGRLFRERQYPKRLRDAFERIIAWARAS